MRRGQSEWFISFLLQSVSVDLLSIRLHNRVTQQVDLQKMKQKTRPKMKYTHRADSHFHITGSVMDKGVLEIISSIFQW